MATIRKYPPFRRTPALVQSLQSAGTVGSTVRRHRNRMGSVPALVATLTAQTDAIRTSTARQVLVKQAVPNASFF